MLRTALRIVSLYSSLLDGLQYGCGMRNARDDVLLCIEPNNELLSAKIMTFSSSILLCTWFDVGSL
jgi:hypothetical protein